MVLDTECNIAVDVNRDPRGAASLASMRDTLLDLSFRRCEPRGALDTDIDCDGEAW